MTEWYVPRVCDAAATRRSVRRGRRCAGLRAFRRLFVIGSGGVETDAQVSRAGVRATPPLCDPSTSPPMPIRFRSLACVLLFPDASKPTVTVNITYLVGSRYEGYGETGMAHLLEHLLFKGTPMHKDISGELTERGARPNGTTSFDRTNYFETVPAADANLRWALDLDADRMVHSFVAAKDLASEMTVVRNEFKLGENDPNSILRERIT